MNYRHLRRFFGGVVHSSPVTLKRVLQHTAILSYLTITGAGFLYTMLRLRVPLLWPFAYFSYSAMAPYQGYTTLNDELIAEGLREDGVWERIDPYPYLAPLRQGGRHIRLHLRGFLIFDADDATNRARLREKYTDLAWLLLDHEQRQGRSYNTIRLLWQEWPISPAGYDALQHDPFTDTELITQVP